MFGQRDDNYDWTQRLHIEATYEHNKLRFQADLNKKVT